MAGFGKNLGHREPGVSIQKSNILMKEILFWEMSNNEKVSRHIHQQNLDKVKWGRMMEPENTVSWCRLGKK